MQYIKGYEIDTVSFTQPSKKRKYKVDFTLVNGAFIEVKGYLRATDRSKYQWIKEQYPKIRLYFIFDKASNKVHKKSNTTYGMWADKYGFKYIEAGDKIPKEWLK